MRDFDHRERIQTLWFWGLCVRATLRARWTWVSNDEYALGGGSGAGRAAERMVGIWRSRVAMEVGRRKSMVEMRSALVGELHPERCGSSGILVCIALWRAGA